MLLAITTQRGTRAALPPVARTLPQAELLHDAIVRALGNGGPADCQEITGRDRDGQPLRGPHGHAHILPLDLDGDRRLDHFLIYAPSGLSGIAQGAIRRVRRTWSKGGAGELQLALAGSGKLATLRTLPEPLRGRMEAVLGPPEGSHTWVSLTPFVPPRFLKERGVNGLAGQITSELRTRGLPPALEVTTLRETPAELALRHFERRRKRGGAPPPADIGMALRLRFAEPVHGPLALGYGSHFGLGLFAAAGEHPAG